MGSNTQYLKCLTNGRTFERTEELAKRGDMVACGVNGQLLTGHIAAEAEAAANGVRESKYIGLMVDGEPGRLFNYTEQLAVKPGAVSIDHPDEWAGDTSNVVAPTDSNVVEIKPTDVNTSANASDNSGAVASPEAAALTRETDSNDAPVDLTDGLADAVKATPADIDGADVGSDLVVPDVSNITDNDEAKSILCKFAFDNFGEQIRRNFGTDRMKEECQKMIDTRVSPEAAAG